MEDKIYKKQKWNSKKSERQKTSKSLSGHLGAEFFTPKWKN